MSWPRSANEKLATFAISMHTAPCMEVSQIPHLHQDWIDPHAFGIVKALQKGGFTTYLVGGCVRDLLLGIHPKDFDIATAAHPPQVKRLIYQSYIIGKRFRLVLVKRNDQQFEVATFRCEVNAEDYPEGIPPGDNVFGSSEEDARRRDFTINGLFYDPVSQELIDYVEGMKDIKNRIMRMIGDPDLRLIEDPIRILRGLRLAHKLGCTIESSLRQAMKNQASQLLRSVLPRRREEFLKILRLPDPALCLTEAYDLDLLKYVSPTLHDMLSDPERNDNFWTCFEAYKPIVRDDKDPNQLFAWITYAMLQTARISSTNRETPITIDDEIFQQLMRDEFGMYKLEQVVVMKAIETLPGLNRTEDFKRRGERRQATFMRNEGFQLGLHIATVDYLLTPRELAFWDSMHLQLADQISLLDGEDDAKPRRKRPRRRKPKSLGRSGGEGDDSQTAENDGSSSVKRSSKSAEHDPFAVGPDDDDDDDELLVDSPMDSAADLARRI